MRVFYDPAYVAAAHGFDTTRKAGWIADRLAERGVALTAPEPVGADRLLAIHDVEYVDAVLSGEPRDRAEEAGFDWDPGWVESLLAVNGGCVAAAAAALADGRAGSLSSGLHHASRDAGKGYCAFNGVALAVLRFLEDVDRVLVIDLDAHCGGGTFDILGDDPRVASVDVSTSSFDSYRPTVAWHLDVVRDAAAYLDTVAEALDALRWDDIDAVVYDAGMDPHEDCDTGGLAGITTDVLRAREELVFERVGATPTAWVLAGGYSGPRLSEQELVDLHLLTFDAAA